MEKFWKYAHFSCKVQRAFTSLTFTCFHSSTYSTFPYRISMIAPFFGIFYSWRRRFLQLASCQASQVSQRMLKLLYSDCFHSGMLNIEMFQKLLLYHCPHEWSHKRGKGRKEFISLDFLLLFLLRLTFSSVFSVQDRERGRERREYEKCKQFWDMEHKLSFKGKRGGYLEGYELSLYFVSPPWAVEVMGLYSCLPHPLLLNFHTFSTDH